MSIKARLGLGIGLLVFFLLVIAVSAPIFLLISRNLDKTIRTSQEIQLLVLEMDRGMERARRLHGNFFIHYPEIGFAAAHEQYAQPSMRQIAQVVTLSKALQEKIEGSTVGEGLRRSRVDLNLYLSSAKRFADTSIAAVEMFTELHAVGRGLDAQLEQLLDELAVELGQEGESVRLFMGMKALIQEYRIAPERPLMQSAFNVAFTLRKSLENDPGVNGSRRQRINSLLDREIEIAEKILTAEAAIKSRFNDIVLQSAAVDTLSSTLVGLAQEEVRKNQQAVRRIQQIALVVRLSIALAGLAVAFFVARMLNQFIIRRVARLTEFAGELRDGNLELVIPEDSGDELGQLARTFNLMVVRIRELVNTLELKVAQRTAELSVSEKRFRQLFENSSSGLVIYEACDNGEDFLIRDCNKAVEAIEQVTRRELIDRRVTEVFPGIGEFGLLAVLRSVWKSGQSARFPLSFYSDGRLSVWRENAVYKLPTGEIVCIYDDCTAQKKAEEEKRAMEVKLQRAQKMEAIGLMASGVAHHLNNILSGIVGFPDLLLMKMPADSELRKPVEIIKESGQRAAAVVADLLTVARGVACKKVSAGLNNLISEYLDSPEYHKIASMHPQIKCAATLAPNLPPILCSHVHIKKCIMNLVANAMESIDGHGHVMISTRSATMDDQMARQNQTSPGEYVVLLVTDSGKGIEDKDLEHIFEPFYSRKVMGVSSTGLGLAVVWNSVVDHGGTIRVESCPEGTTFSLYFPASAQAAADEDHAADPGDFKGWGEKLLVVDDEAMLRDLAASMLNRLGYAVHCISSGEEAVDYLRENPVDLVLLDMKMDPGINGLETYKRILSFLPSQKTIIVSGFSESEAIKDAQLLGVKGIVKKPYSMEELGRMVRQELDR